MNNERKNGVHEQVINPLENSLIAEKVFSFLDVNSVKNARQVNELWNAEGAKALLNKCYVKSPFKILGEKPSRKNKKKFRAFLAQSRTVLKVPNISIDSVRDVELWKTFGILGPGVTSLQLNVVDREADLIHNLLDILPNLKVLTIKDFRNRKEVITKILAHKSRKVLRIPNITIAVDSDVELLRNFRVLGKLVTSLELKIFVKANGWLQNILELLPNLEYLSLKNFKPKRPRGFSQILMEVMSTFLTNINRKPLIISPMNLEFIELLELEVVELLSDFKKIRTDELKFSMWPRLFDREIPDAEARLANTINKLLLTNRNFLKKLTLKNCELFLPLLEFPCMNQLTQVKFCFTPRTARHLSHCKFPPSFQFSEKIPNLDLINVHCERIPYAPMKRNFLTKLFETIGQAPSVKRLSYCGGSSYFTIDPLFQVFPNVEDFQLIRTKSTQSLFESLWTHGKNLKKLHLRFDARSDWNLADLDLKFIGFTRETVNMIEGSRKFGLDTTVKTWERFRVNPSILNLKELEHLTIHLNRTNLPKSFFVTVEDFAFKLMPNTFIDVRRRLCIKSRNFKKWSLRLESIFSHYPKS